MEKINCPSHPRHQAELGQIIFISTDLSCNTGQCKEEVSMRYSPLENILAHGPGSGTSQSNLSVNGR